MYTPMETWFLILKSQKYTLERKERIFNKLGWSNWISECRRMQIGPYLSPCTKPKLKWTKNLNIKLCTLTLIEDKMGEQPWIHWYRRQLSKQKMIAQALRSAINKWDLMKLKSFQKAKVTVIQTKQQPTEWGKNFTSHTSDREPIPNIY